MRRTLLAASLLAIAGCDAAAQTGRDAFSGVWIVTSYRPTTSVGPRQRIIRTVEGEIPPMQPWAAQLYEARIQAEERGVPVASLSANCVPTGVPHMMIGAPYPIQILQTPGQVTMLFEEMHAFRVIYMDQAHPAEMEPSFLGHSVGRWEGDTLVIDSRGFNDKTTLDLLGMPHTEQLRVVERLRMTGPDTMEDVITIEDPGAFTRPWTMRTTYQRIPGGRVGEYMCENNRNPNVGGVQATGAVAR